SAIRLSGRTWLVPRSGFGRGQFHALLYERDEVVRGRERDLFEVNWQIRLLHRVQRVVVELDRGGLVERERLVGLARRAEQIPAHRVPRAEDAARAQVVAGL